MALSHLKLKCIYLLSALFMSAALLPELIESRLNRDSGSLWLPLTAVAVFIVIGFVLLLLQKKTVVSMSFKGESCVITTEEKAYKLCNSDFTEIKKGISNFIYVRCKVGKGTRSFILRRSRISHPAFGSEIDEMRRRFPNAEFSV